MYKLKTNTCQNLENGKDEYTYQIMKVVPPSKFLWFKCDEYEEDTDYGDTNLGIRYYGYRDIANYIRGFTSKEKALTCLKNLNKVN